MPAETLKCPMCGAPASTDAARCEHCGARLATVACPSCFGLMFAGDKFCSHCGAKAAPVETPAASPELCPRCRAEMNAIVVGGANLRECPHCEGTWVDADSLRQLCAGQEKQASVPGMGSAPATDASEPIETNIHYLPCPVCGQLMNRVNFAGCSNVIVEVCAVHGTWFDRDQLRRVVGFIRAGGMEKARARQIAELEERRRLLEEKQRQQGYTSHRGFQDF